jgi:hypothetical protein
MKDPNPKTYYKKIFPLSGRVIAKICYLIGDKEMEASTSSFGSFSSNSPTEANFMAAAKWADDQLSYIQKYSTGKVALSPDEIIDLNDVEGLNSILK